MIGYICVVVALITSGFWCHHNYRLGKMGLAIANAALFGFGLGALYVLFLYSSLL